MGVVGRSGLQVTVSTAIYAVLVSITAWRHEPWADEAQSWLLARDSSLFTLWTRLLHYEGTPGLWHSVLWAAQRAGLPYLAINFLSGTLGVTAAYLVFRYAPFALPVRLLLPFSYFLAYQYAVVARSYSLIPPLLFGLAALYPQRERRPVVYVGLLSALALCSVHGLVLSTAIALTTFRHRALAVYIVIAALGAWAAYPAPDVTFVRHLNLSCSHLADRAGAILSEAFAGYRAVSMVLIALTIPFLRRGRGLFLFLIAASTLIVLMAVIYGQVWHFGTVFLAWVFSLWIAAVTARPGRLANSALLAVLAVQVFWTAASIYADAKSAYSGGLSTANYLKEQHILEAGLYGIGYASAAVQPYFPRNIFSNFRHSYWDWSAENRMIRNYDKITESNAPWVLVGYKTKDEDYIWNNLVRRSGYRKVRHFEGHIIWKGKPFEPESFDLYRRE